MTTAPSTTVEKSLWRNVPAAMVAFRLMLGPLLLWDALDGTVSALFLVGIVLGPLCDLLDGMIARRLGIASEALRVADSWVDTAFYLCVAGAAWFTHRAEIVGFRAPLLVLLGTQVVCWVVEFARFRRFAAYHAFTAKLWGLSLFVTAFSLFAFDYAGACFGLMIVFGLVSLLEGLAITLILPCWTHDVASVRAAWQIRQATCKEG